MIISDCSAFPFFLWLPQWWICTICILMAYKVNKVRMGHCCVTICVHKPISSCWYFTYLQFLSIDIHSKNFSLFFSISFLAYNAFRPFFFLNLNIFNLFHEFILIFLHLHLSHNFFFLLLSKSFLFFILLID